MVTVKRWEVVEQKTLIKDRYQSEAALVTRTAQPSRLGGKKKKHKNHVEPNYIFDFALIYVGCKIYTHSNSYLVYTLKKSHTQTSRKEYKVYFLFFARLSL